MSVATLEPERGGKELTMQVFIVKEEGLND